MDNKQKQIDIVGFTLFELLLVLAITLFLLTFASVNVFSAVSSYRVSSAAGQLRSDIAYGMQLASKLNRPVEFRFYGYTGRSSLVSKQYTRYQFLKRDPKTAQAIPISKVFELEPGVGIHRSQVFSTFFSLREKPPNSLDPEIVMGDAKDRSYAYISMQLRPDGSTSLTKDRLWSITLVNETHCNSRNLPRNFRTMVVNSVNGSVTLY